jgi:murein DD-endopeptidase MepM/ murein hydrolase activator NlpD
MAEQPLHPHRRFVLVRREHAPVRIELHPFTLAAVGVAAVLLLAWCAAATSYALLHDKVLGSIADRSLQSQRGAGAEIFRLRTELDRATSRHLLDTHDVAERIEALTQRQKQVERQQEALSAMSVPPPVMRAPLDRQSALTPPEEGTPLERLASGYDRIEQRQKVQIAALQARVDTDRAAMKAAYASLGVAPLITRPVQAGMGGPFIPMFGGEKIDGMSPDMERLAERAAERDRLRAGLDALPVRNPIPGSEITSGFGGRQDPFLGSAAFHSGVDLRAPAGTPVAVTAAGTVVSAGWSGGYGQMVEVRHGNGLSTRYGHMSSIGVQVGDKVKTGDTVGRAGSTGRSTGAHLHYEVRVADEAVNPARYLAAGSALD